MNVAVIGAGICGASAARFMSARGHDVTLYEQFELFHRYGSSHGPSRIVRRAYPDRFYTAAMSEAYPLWAELETLSSKRLLHEVGLLYFGNVNSPDVASVAAGLSELGVPHELLDSKQVSRHHSRLQLAPDEVALFTPGAGWVDAGASLMTSLELARAQGANVIDTTPVTPAELSTSYDAFVVCAGPWIKEFVPLEVRTTLQTVSYFPTEMAGPVWIEDSADLAYGFPSIGGHVKIGVHRLGPEIDPNSSARDAIPGDVEIARDAALRRFGIDIPPAITEGCVYTSTPSEDFKLGRIGVRGFYASACSGHGFKFGPYIGKLLADFVDGTDAPENHPRWAG